MSSPLQKTAHLLTIAFCGILGANASAQVRGSSGSFTTSIPIATPGFRGLEPNLSLVYNSSAGNSIMGVGWTLSGFPTIERQGVDGGTPSYDATDTYRLNGSDLKPCGASASPGCVAGGTHFTEHENYQRIEYDAGTNWWTVWARNGTRTFYTSNYGRDRERFAGVPAW